MDTNNLNHFDPQLDFPQKRLERRRKLLPWWVVAFIWLFLVFFAIMPVGVIMGLLKYNFEISLLGITTHQPISLIGMFLILLFSFKGVTALALWAEKAWAVGLAKVDAIISIAICFLVMAYALFVQHSFSLRLELIVLFLYYYKMNQIQYDWENFDSPESTTEDAPEAL
ncbi:MAG TPA: hypothetical protein VK671_16275 [Mucilaginibacter sp.]|jgi:hypothetical protein|nr:hypothetical protein [Mucilaginibacter sp.]